MTTGYRYARRAEVLGESVYDHTPGAIVLSSGLAYPPFLPTWCGKPWRPRATGPPKLSSTAP